MTPQQSAFLTLIAHAEGTDLSADSYRVCYGYSHTIVDMSWHPACETSTHPVEWPGVSIAHLGPQYAHSISTAAGRYQITRPTFLSYVPVLDIKNFSPATQDDIALQLIKDHKGLEPLNDGDIEAAITACSSCWASLPGSESGQPQHQMAALLYVYEMSMENA